MPSGAATLTLAAQLGQGSQPSLQVPPVAPTPPGGWASGSGASSGFPASDPFGPLPGLPSQAVGCFLQLPPLGAPTAASPVPHSYVQSSLLKYLLWLCFPARPSLTRKPYYSHVCAQAVRGQGWDTTCPGACSGVRSVKGRVGRQQARVGSCPFAVLTCCPCQRLWDKLPPGPSQADMTPLSR